MRICVLIQKRHLKFKKTYSQASEKSFHNSGIGHREVVKWKTNMDLYPEYGNGTQFTTVPPLKNKSKGKIAQLIMSVSKEPICDIQSIQKWVAIIKN